MGGALGISYRIFVPGEQLSRTADPTPRLTDHSKHGRVLDKDHRGFLNHFLKLNPTPLTPVLVQAQFATTHV